ncbi:N-alpha-acetyltransferase 30 [Microbotryomycetes sp. JL201]|nr:N-alpha-acetyltransferase 30 [Microbotryomycetes sp. JL201]
MSTDPLSLAELKISSGDESGAHVGRQRMHDDDNATANDSTTTEIAASRTQRRIGYRSATRLGGRNQSTQGSLTSFRGYDDTKDIPVIMRLVDSELSEPYNWYTYRYFLQDWPNLCFFAYDKDTNQDVGTVLCKQDVHRDKLNRGYLAMLSVSKPYRAAGVATQLVRLAITEMVANGAQEVVLETEYDNVSALKFYSKLGFVKEKRLYRFYLNAKDAFRLKLKLENGHVKLFDRDARAARQLVESALERSRQDER